MIKMKIKEFLAWSIIADKITIKIFVRLLRLKKKGVNKHTDVFIENVCMVPSIIWKKVSKSAY